MKRTKVSARLKRKRSIRGKISGTGERPRMSVFRSNKHIYVQVIDDVSGKTLASASTLGADVRESVKDLDKKSAAKKVGEVAAKRCLDANITAVVFDRNGYIYTGRVAAVAEGAREAGLQL